MAFYYDDFFQIKSWGQPIKPRIGIRREDKNRWEKRVPLTPEQVLFLGTTHNIETVIQPSKIRIFSDDQYIEAGAVVQEDLSSCAIIFGIKEMPASFFQKDKAYAFFSHTIKGQKYNMDMLKKMIYLGCHLIDYERVIDQDKNRLLFFGRYAGLAGMIDTLWALGKRLSWEGTHNPFASLNRTFEYDSLDEAKEAVASVGQCIQRDGVPSLSTPLLCGFAGYGHVSLGAQEIFNLLPYREIDPDDIETEFNRPKTNQNFLYKVVFYEKDLVEPLENSRPFDLQDYYDHPENYRSKFNKYLQYMTLLINGIFWSPKYPRLVTKANLENMWKTKPPPLRIIGDITCDIEGAIECTLHTTQPDNPTFVYDPLTDQALDGYQGNGLVVLAVDNLPCELPGESSDHFGRTLIKFIPEIATAEFSTDLNHCNLPPEIYNGLILHSGHLTPQYKYMKKYL